MCQSDGDRACQIQLSAQTTKKMTRQEKKEAQKAMEQALFEEARQAIENKAFTLEVSGNVLAAADLEPVKGMMVGFPGRFFETHAAKMSNINQIMLVIASVILVCISVTIWKRRRVH